MPTYEHVCENGHSFEEFQSIVAQPIRVCPICGGHAERKISGGTGLIFKGSGFYVNDYGRGRKGGGDEKKNNSQTKSKPTESPPPAPKTDSSSSGKES
jgi:putative FmdB family regulatory protein